MDGLRLLCSLALALHLGMAQLVTESVTSAIPSSDCDRPIVPHGEIEAPRGNYNAGDFVLVKCTEGYRLQYRGGTTLHLVCGNGGIWHDVLGETQFPHCERVGGCPTNQIPHGSIQPIPDGYMPGTHASVQCDSGYVTYTPGGELVMCHSDGIWQSLSRTSLANICKPRACPHPEDFPYGTMHISRAPSDFFLPGYLSNGSSILYTCRQSYKMDDLSKSRVSCVNGHWSSEPPTCIKETVSSCPYPVSVPNASFKVHTESGVLPPGSEIPDRSWIVYTCNKGYVMDGDQDIKPFCFDKQWQGNIPKCTLEVVRLCLRPPDIDYGNYTTTGQVIDTESDPRSAKKYMEGVKVFYYCNNGYKLTGMNNTSMLQCKAGDWHGFVPSCERRTHCDPPMDIQNGNWVAEFYMPDYGIGTRITYECRDGYKAMGTTDLECLSSGYWSDYVPRCLASNEYCSEPGPLENGVYMCRPSHCDMFKVGTSVHYVCNKGYEPLPDDVLVQECLQQGIWSATKPVCRLVTTLAADEGTSRFNTSTLTVVIATSCGVLGLLVIIMVVVALQRRRKQHPRNVRLSPPPPPPYHPTPPTGLVDDPDRVALIAFADGVQVVLPSYDEAVRGRGGSRLSRYTSDSTRGSIRSSSSRDYRPLPSLPSGLRAGGPQIREIPPDHHRDHHRNSIITTTSITTRDNLSLALGSIDTMNISDGTSTSVTVDTASSNPSIATSQRAAAGSIESSSTNGSLATEDAPLLDQNHYNTETMRSYHSSTSDTHRCQCADRIGGYDTLHSQCSRSQSESSPIVEVPEDHKDP